MTDDKEFLEAIKDLGKEEIEDIMRAINGIFTSEYAKKLLKPFEILQNQGGK